MDKNKATIEFISNCPYIRDNPLFFNFINAEEDNNQIVTTSNDIMVNRPYIDGSVLKRYTFTIVNFKSISDTELVQGDDISNENVDDMLDLQGLIDWIDEQNEAHNYPDFGTTCEIQQMITTSENPRFDGVNTAITPALAMYSVAIRIDYIDYKKVIWS